MRLLFARMKEIERAAVGQLRSQVCFGLLSSSWSWVFGLSLFHVAGGLIHLLLVIDVIVSVIKLVTRSRLVSFHYYFLET
jgi:Family of unknown function (DUF5670)